MNKIAPCLWFDGKAEEAAHFYMSIFRNAKIVSTMRHGEAGPGPKGSVLAVTFELDGQQFIALNGGPHFTFTPAISLFVTCETQEEVDAFWERLSAGGEPGQCGWLKDKYGVSWQVVPSILGEMPQDTDAGKANGVMEALMKMGKLDIGKLRHAYGQA